MSTPHTLTFKRQAIVRLVHAGGRVTLNDLLSRYQAQALTVNALRRTLDELVRLGWLTKLRMPRPMRANGVGWTVTEEALPHLWESGPLPHTPDALPMRPTTVSAPPPPPRRRPTRPAPRSATVAQPRRPYTYEPYVPPPAPPMRAGALDHLKFKSHGACNAAPNR